MCDCFHLAFPNWHAASSGTGAGRRLRGPEPGTEDDSVCDEPSQFTEAERPRPQGSSPVEEYPEIEKYSDSDKECEAEYDPHHKSGSGKKTKKSGLGSMFEKRSTPKMSKLKEAHSPESGLIVKTAKDGCAEGLIYGGGGKEGIFIKEVVPESPASKSLKLKEGDQILSATVYFDNVSYEDAIQILEHAQAYKVKLCLKRKPDITETEPAGETDVIPEEELDAPEIREQRKTKRRGDARISWPKFPSFGKGRKSRFTRSHSSSEADEQRKLELSPTTSDTESPIKSQDALKGKKRHKMKLSVLTKRGRISSSEDQDTDAPTGQTSGDHYQTASEMLSPECPESLTGEIPEDLKVEENLRPEQSDQKLTDPQNVHHKVELISLDSTLKTADLTVALADQESSSGIKSPSEKKKKKERSELKMKILGKDKSHKKDAKAKASPKRLKTLGASFEIDQPENEKSDLIPGSESHTEVQGDQLPLDANTQIISSESTRAKSVTAQMEMSVPKVELVQKSPKKGEEKAKKGKDIKQKQGRKTSPTFKLPKIGLSDIAAEETIQKTNANVEESPARIEQRKSDGTEVNEDPYDRLSKSTLTRTQLPKREEIEIPGMEDMSRKITAKGMKEPKMVLPGHYEEIQAETVQLSIDVDSVKEAVSKLPGFKVPKVDTSGVPIPEEITVIDANAQRISVKTPTKVVDTKSKHDAHFTRFDVTASSEISMPTVKLPKITPADQTTEEPLTETKVDFEEHKTKQKQSDKELKTEVYKREDIVIPGKESAQEAILQAQGTEKTQEGLTFEYKSAATFSPKDSDKKSKKTRLTMPSFGIAKPDIRIPDIGIDFPKQNVSEQKRDTIKGERTVLLQEVKTSKSETKTGQTWGAISDVKIPEIDSIEYIDSAGGSPAQKDGGIRVPGFGVTLDATKPKADISFPETRSEVKDVALPKAKAEIKLPEAPEADITLGRVDVSVPAQKLEVTKPELEIKPLQAEHGQGSKFKMPKFGIKMPKIKGPEFDLSLSKKDGAVTLSEAKADVKIQDAPEADASLGKVDLSITAQKVEVKKPELEIKPLQTEGELDGQGSKFKMPKLGITMPKVKGPEIDFSLSKKDTDVTLPEAKAEVKLPAVELKDPSAKVEIKTPEIKGAEKDVEGSPSKFKMPAFKLPKFGAAAPNASFEVSSKTKDIQIPETQLKAPEGVDTAVDITASNIDMEGPSLDVKTTAADTDGKGSKFKMPKFGISLPKVKGPEIDLSLSKKDVDVTLPEAEVDVKLPEAEHTESGIKVDIKGPEIAVHQQDVEESPSKFKMPTFKLPKFGGGAPNVSVEVPDMDKDVKIDGADINISEEGPAVNIAVPSVDVEGPSIDVKTTGSEREGKGSKFKMPHLSFSMPKAKGPQISLTKKDVDVTLPEAKAKVQLPEAPEVDISCGNADVFIPEANLEVEQTELDTKPLHGEVEFDGQGSKFKMPKLGMSMPKVKGPEIHFGLSKKDEDVTLPEVKAEVKVPEVEIKEPFAKVDVKAPEAKASAKGTEGSPSKFKMPTFKLPKFGVGTPTVSVEVPDKDKDVKIDGADINISEEGSAVNIAVPSIEGPSIDVKTTGSEHEGKGSKFKMPHLSFSMPKVKGPKIDLSMPKKDVDITLPEAKADVKLPEVDLGEVDVSIPEAKVEVPEAEAEVRLPDAEYEAEMDGHGEKFKIPKFGIKLPKVKGPEFDLSIPKKDTDVKIPEKKADVKLPETDLGKVDVSIPEAKMELKKPELEVQGLQTEGELDGQGSKFKMPKFGIKMPKLKGPEFDLSLSKKDVDVTLPEAKAEVKLPDAPEAEVTLGSVHVSIPEQKMKTEKPELEIKPLQTEAELEGQGSKFKMPKFGIKMPKLKGPEFDLSLSKKDVNVTLPEAKAEVKLPDAPEAEVTLGSVHVSIPEQKMEVEKPELEIKPLQTEAELEGQGSKFKMPKFGIKMPKLKGPEFDLSLSKKDVDVTLPEAKAEVKLPDAPEAEVTLGSVHVSIPEKKMEVEKPELEIKPLQTEAELEGQGSKFKMPKFGIKMPKLKGPEFDLSLSKKDVDVTLPEAKADINLPNAEIKEPSTKVAIKAPEMEVAAKDAEGSPSKFKMPNLSFTLPKVKGPGIDLSLSKKDTGITLPDNKAEVKLPEAPKIDVSLGKAEVLIPEAKVEVKKPEVQVKTLQTDIELEGQGSKFKMPKLGITMPKVKGPEIDLSLSKKDADRTLPKAKAEVKLPDAEFKDPSAKVEIKAQLGHVEGSTNVTAEIPEMDKDIKVSGAGQNIDIEGPSLDVKMAGTEAEGKGRKFKMPKFGISLPKVQAPETDLSLSKKDGDFKLPEAKAEVKLPEAPETDVNLGKVDVSIPEGEVEVQKPGLEIKPLQAEVELDGQGSKFKMPKFGISIPKVKGPEIDFSLSKKDVDVTLPEVKAEVNLPDAELKEPSVKVEVKAPETEAQLSSVKGSPSKFKLPTFKFPKFGVASPNVSAELPGTDKEIKIDGAQMQISAPHTDVDVPEVKAEVQLPEVEVKESSGDVVIEQQPGVELDAKLKKPRFSLPRFSFSKPSVKAPEVDVNLQDVNVAIPQGKVEIKGGEVNMKQPEHEEEVDGQGSKFKMPKLGITMPKVTGPEIDLGLSKKDVDVTLPETKAEVKLPDVELKEPSAEVEIKPPEIKVVTKDTEESPSKFKMPTFKLPKFGVGTPSSTVKVPDMGKDVQIDGADIKIPEEVLTVSMAAPLTDSEGPSIEMEMTGTEHEGKGRKFKLPSLAFSVPQVKGPDIDLSLSKKDVDVTLPKADVPLPDAELKEPSAKVEIKAPETEVQTSTVEGSPSKFKMPTFKLPKFGAASPQVSVEVPDLDKDMKVDGADLTLPEAKADVKLPDVEIKEPEGSVSGGDAKLRKTSWTLPRFSFSKTSVKGPEADVNLDTPKVDVTLSEAKTEVHPPDIGIKESSSISVEGAPAVDLDVKLKKPRFSLPKISFSKQSTKELEVDVSLQKADVPLPEGNVKAIPPEVELKAPEGDAELDGQETKFKMPKFGISMSKVKGPDIDLSLSKKDVEVTPPKAKADFEIPEAPKIAVDVKSPEHEAEIDGQDSKFKMPKLGITMPKVKGPEIDLGLSKKDANVTLPEAKAEVKLPDVELKDPSAKVEIKAPEVEAQLGHVEGSPSKFKLPTFKLPKFGGASSNVTAEVPEMDKDINVDGAGLKIPKNSAAVDITAQSIDIEGPSLDVKMTGTEAEGKGSKFKMPKFGISLPKVRGPEIDLNLSKKDVDVTLPEAKVEVQPPDVKIKQPSAKVEIKAPEIEAQIGNVEGSPSKLKMPTFTLPKFGAATPKMSVPVPDVDKDIKIDGTKVEVLKAGATVDGTASSIDTADVKGSELEGSGSKFKMPQFGISIPKVKGPEIDLTLSKKDVDVTLPEAKTEVTLPSAEVKEPEGVISMPDAPTVEVETKLKRPNWTFPKFSFSRTGSKAPDVDVNIETPKADVTSPEVKAEVCLPDVEVKGTLGVASVEEAPAAELDASLKKPKFSLPRFSFSKPSVTVPEVSAELPHVDVSLPEGEVKVQQPEMEIKAPELEAEYDKEGSAQGSKFKLPKFGIALPKAKGPEVDLNASQKDVDITLPEVKAEVKLPEAEVKESSASTETEAKSKDVGGSPLKFKIPTLKMPKFGGVTYDVTLEAPDAGKAETDGAKLKEDVALNIKGPSVDIKTDMSKATISDTETPKTETEGAGHGSPSKFKLPSFKMPRLSFSRPKPEDEHTPGDNEAKGDQQEMEVEQREGTKSPKLSLTSFGEILKSIDVEFDVPKTDKGEENLETLKEAHETSEPSGKQLEAKEKETTTKQDTTKSPERTGWFKFPKFGLSSPSEPAKISEKDEHKDEKSPAGETGEEDISPTCSVQSSDAFADVSSTITSEHVGLSLSSPTKVTVKYSDPNEATGLGEIKSNIITSTTRTGLISFEPNVPEKITILSSGVSSSSEDTLRLESGKIHVITTNIQATPEAQHAKLLTAVQVQPAASLPLTSGANEAASWTVEESQGGKRTVFERRLVRETSSERSESQGTIVITKQITHIIDSSEPISGETASSIQRLRETVHSEKMRFFDGAEK